MIEIPLTQGQIALIDNEDYDLVSQYKWCAWWDHLGKRYYSQTGIGCKPHRHTVQMHRFILGLTDPKMHTDHINGNGLDNRRCNLRACSPSQNKCNTKKQINNASGYKGVYLHKQAKRWRAAIQLHNKRISLGLYGTPEEAYAAYCKAALELHGEFAHL